MSFPLSHAATGGAPAPMTSLPSRAGLGLKPQHFRQVLEAQPDIGFFEIHAENYLVEGGPFHHYLGLIHERYPLSVHGVGLSIGAEQPLDESHLERLARLIQRYQPESFSEHLAWSSHGEYFLNDLLPIPYDAATLTRVCEHIDRVQERLKRRMLLENPATYVEFATSTRDEATFIAEVIRRTGCGLLLDVNNAYVSGINHGRDAAAYIDALPLEAIGEIYLAGFAEDRDGAAALPLCHRLPVSGPSGRTRYRPGRSLQPGKRLGAAQRPGGRGDRPQPGGGRLRRPAARGHVVRPGGRPGRSHGPRPRHRAPRWRN